MPDARLTQMKELLAAFLRGRSPLAEEEIVWSGGGLRLVQTRSTYALEKTASPPLQLVTSVRALLTRGADIMVVRDPAGCHIVPGGRLADGEGLLDALKRELLEETGWSVRCEPVRIAMFHYQIHSSRPDGFSYPYPDFLQLIYQAEAGEYDSGQIEVGGYELEAGFRALGAVKRLPLSSGEKALLSLVGKK